jgi:phage terminase small subunit
MRGVLPARTDDTGAPHDVPDHSLDTFQDSSPAFAALGSRHKAFFCEYVGEARRSGKVAALRCGFSETRAKQAGSRIVRRADFQAALAAFDRKMAAQAEVTVQEIVAGLARIARANMQDYMRIGADGEAVLDFSALTRDQAAVIHEVMVDTRTRRKGKSGRRAYPVSRLKLYDQLQAWEKLGRYLGAFKEAPPVQTRIAVISAPEVCRDMEEWQARYGRKQVGP